MPGAATITLGVVTSAICPRPSDVTKEKPPADCSAGGGTCRLKSCSGYHNCGRIAPGASADAIARAHPRPNVFATREIVSSERARIRERFEISPWAGIEIQCPLSFITPNVVPSRIACADHLARHGSALPCPPHSFLEANPRRRRCHGVNANCRAPLEERWCAPALSRWERARKVQRRAK